MTRLLFRASCAPSQPAKWRRPQWLSAIVLAGLLVSADLSGHAAGPGTPPAKTQLPTGEQVVVGQATVSRNQSQMTINQSTNRAAIDWQTFNIGSAAHVDIRQPSSGSVLLNRIIGSEASQLFGKLTANGQVFLSNPNGIYFAPGATVDVGGLVATTHHLTLDDFMAGRDRFTRNGATGRIVNEAQLRASLEGYIALLAPEVRNHGVIIAELGTVALAAGEAYELHFDRSRRLEGIRVEPASIHALVENGQAVLAPGGSVILSALGVHQLQGSVIRNDGTLEASSLVAKGGRILLEGDRITLGAGSSLAATGATGGGDVLVGGGWQGSGTMRQATTVTMEEGATIDVSATAHGHGGTAVLWSDVNRADSTTTMRGRITARGAGEDQSGGAVETSGRRLSVTGTVDAGHGGQWLLDPTYITVATSGGTVTPASIESALNAGNTVTLDTAGAGTDAGDITVSNSISKTAGGDATLSMKADRRITIDSGVSISSTSNKLDLTLDSSADSSLSGIFSGSGSLTKNGGGFLKINAPQTYTGSTIINGGILMLGANNVLPDTSRVVINGHGILSLNSFSDTVGSIEGSGIIENGSVVRDGIALWLDAGNSASYDGTRTTWYDLSGNGYHGTLFGSPTYNGANRQFEFTTNSQYVRLTSLPTNFLSKGDGILNGLTVFTVADFGSANFWERIVDFGNGSPSSNIILSRFGNTNALNFELYNPTTANKVDPSGANTLIPSGGGVRSYAGTANGTNMVLYQNGTPQLTVANSALPDQVLRTNNYVGKSNWVVDDTLRGTIGVILVYDRALNAVEVQQNHNAFINRAAATLTVGGNNLSTTFSGKIENGADTVNLAKIGTGTLTLSGANNYSGTTTVRGGTLQVGAGGAAGTLGVGAVTNNATVTFDRSDAVTVANAIGGSGALIKSGTNTLTLTGLHTYTGPTTINDGTLVIENNAPTSSSSSFNGPGALAIQPAASSFSSAFSTSGWSLGNTLTGLALGKTGNTAALTVDRATSIAGPISLYGGNIAINAALTATGTNSVSMTGTVTDGPSGSIIADKLALLSGTVTLDNTSHSVNTLAASSGSLTYRNAGALNVGTVGSTDGITAIGAVDISTQSGDLIISQNVTTTNTTATALTLNAGRSIAAGTTTGGNLLISGSPTVSVGSGGTAKLLSGGIAGSTGLTSLIGAGSGRFRYNSDESAANYTLGLSTGLNAVYREQPSITVTADSQIVTYGTALTTTVSLSGQNGDTAVQAFSVQPSVTVGGSTSSSGNPIVGSHALTLSGATSQLGYATAYVDGNLTVNQKTLTPAFTSANKPYDGTTTATVSSSDDRISGDVVTITRSAAFADKNAADGVTVNVSGVSLSGTDAGNYVLSGTTGTATADITRKVVTVSGLAANTKAYDGTTAATISDAGSVTAGVGSETLGLNGGTSATFADANAGTGKTVTVTGYSLADGTGGGLATNYQLSISSATTTADITRVPLTVQANHDARFVTQSDSAGYAGVTYFGLVGGETSGVLSGTLNMARSNSGTNSVGIYNNVLVPSGLTSSNYSITFGSGTYTIVPADQLQVRVTNVTTTYGSTPTYSIASARYLSSGSSTIVDLSGNVSASGNAITITDGVGGAAQFTVGATGATLSGAGLLPVGVHAIGSSGVTSTSANFSNTLTLIGSHMVNARSLTVLPSGASKTYDGTKLLNGTVVSLSGVQTGDAVSATGNVAFATTNVGTNLGYTIGGVHASGADFGNYALDSSAAVTGTNGAIVPRSVTVSGLTVASKPYDGTTTASVDHSGVTFNNSVAGDVLTASSTVGAFADPLVGTGKSVTLSGTLYGGADIGNYTVTGQTSTIADITGFPNPTGVTNTTSTTSVVNALMQYSRGNQPPFGSPSTLPVSGLQALPHYMAGGVVGLHPDAQLASLSPSSEVTHALVVEWEARPTNDDTEVVSVSIPETLLKQGEPIAFTLPDALIHKLGGIPNEFTQSDGASLPAWLTYDAQTMTFRIDGTGSSSLPAEVVATFQGERILVTMVAQAHE